MYTKEPEHIAKNRNEALCDVSMPIFMYGFKLNPEIENVIKTEICLDIILEMLTGKSSNLYEELYESGLITSPLGVDITLEKEYAFFNISGESREIDKVIEKIKNAIINMKENGIDEESFLRIKKRLLGDYIRQFNSVDKIAHMFMANIFRGVDIFEYVNAYQDISTGDIEKVMNKYFDFEKEAVSIVKPN